MSIEDRIRATVRDWPQWSIAERRKLDAIADEVMDHCRNGNRVGFTKRWCERVLGPLKLYVPAKDDPANDHLRVFGDG